MSENIFEMAVRLKIRFEYRGQIGVEDLWDLSLEALNSIYKSLVVASRNSTEEGLLNTRSREDEVRNLKIEVVKQVFEAKKEEMAGRRKLAENKQKKDKLKEILEQRQNTDLMSLSPEQLQKMIDELD